MKKKVPPPELVEIIMQVAKKIAPKYVFGYHSVEDIEQEAFILGMEGYKNYDGKRSLYNFLYTHIKNRLGNIKRKNYERIHPPCDKCPFDAYIKKTKSCKKYDDMEDCSLYYNWIRRNIDKKGIMCPSNIHAIDIGGTDDTIDDAEMIAIIEKNLTPHNRKTWLRLKSGDKINKLDRQLLLEEIRKIQDVK